MVTPALKAAMLAKLPDGVRTNDFDLLVYYLRVDLLGCPSGRDGYSYFGTSPPNRAAPAFKVRRDTTAWKAGVTMYEGGIHNAGTLARAIGHSLGLHHAGGEGPTQPPKAKEGAFTEFAMAGSDGAAQKKSTTYGEEDAFMGSVRYDAAGQDLHCPRLELPGLPARRAGHPRHLCRRRGPLARRAPRLRAGTNGPPG